MAKKGLKNFIGFLFIVLFLGGCAMKSTWHTDSVTDIKKGMSKEEVISVVGVPKSKAIENSGTEVWTYTKPSSSQVAANTMIAVASLGMGGVPYVDTLTVTFKSNKVSDYRYVENAADGLMGALSK